MSKLRVIKEGPWENNSASTPPLLLLHGFPDNATLYDEVALHYLSKGRRIARIAWPNSGMGPTLRWGASFSELVSELIQIGEVLGPCDVIGHDWGAAITWMYQKHRPDLVKSIVAVDVGAELPHDLWNLSFIVAYQIPLAFAFLLPRKLEAFADLIVRLNTAVFNRPQMSGHLKAEACFWYYHFWKQMITKREFFGPTRDSKCPVLYVYGSEKPVQFQSEEWLAKMKQRKDCQVVKMETGHWVFREKLDEFLQHVDRFYESATHFKGT